MHLRDIGAGAGTQHGPADIRKWVDSAGTVRAELAIIFRTHLALVDLDNVAAPSDPISSQLGEAGHDVDPDGRICIGTRRVVNSKRRLSGRRLEIDLPHRDAQIIGAANMDLAAAANCGGADLMHWAEGRGMARSLNGEERRARSPSRRGFIGSVQRVRARQSQPRQSGPRGMGAV